MVKAVEGLEEIEKDLQPVSISTAQSHPATAQLDRNISASRSKAPTLFGTDGRITTSVSLARQRRRHIFEAARRLHGGDNGLAAAAEGGLTVTSLARCSAKVLITEMSSN